MAYTEALLLNVLFTAGIRINVLNSLSSQCGLCLVFQQMDPNVGQLDMRGKHALNQ